EICDRHGILLILDEVMCGMGRTGSLFACEQDEITPDIVTIAKGLGAGYQPIGATLCTSKIYDDIASGSGFFQHGHTYIGHPVACAASLAVLKAFEDRDLITRCRKMGERLDDALRAQFADHPHIGDIRGRGLFRGLELVENRETKEPFDPAFTLNKLIKRNAFSRGLICYPMGGTIDGRNGDHVLLAPPFIISDNEIGYLVEMLSGAIEDAISSARPANAA
ncbi:MAG: aminotransferase class III-fold pyridoxal phosphate-dependent enzyme, partial [Pseudomonadota bacterium]